MLPLRALSQHKRERNELTVKQLRASTGHHTKDIAKLVIVCVAKGKSSGGEATRRSRVRWSPSTHLQAIVSAEGIHLRNPCCLGVTTGNA